MIQSCATIMKAAAIAAIAAALACGSGSALAAQNNSGGTTGGKCKVVSGPNKGKTGTYTTDEYGKKWCEGDWGGTECGPGKCQDAAKGGAGGLRDLTVRGRDVRAVQASPGRVPQACGIVQYTARCGSGFPMQQRSNCRPGQSEAACCAAVRATLQQKCGQGALLGKSGFSCKCVQASSDRPLPGRSRLHRKQ